MMRNSVVKPFVLIKRGMNTGSNSFRIFDENYKSMHIPTTVLQKIALSVGASIVSLLDPSRGGNSLKANYEFKQYHSLDW